MNIGKPLDLIDKMLWEDSDKVEKLSLTDAGFEELPLEEETHVHGKVFRSGIYAYLNWFYDGEQDDFLL